MGTAEPAGNLRKTAFELTIHPQQKGDIRAGSRREVGSWDPGRKLGVGKHRMRRSRAQNPGNVREQLRESHKG